MTDLPKRIEIHEEGPREGFQIEAGPISTADKVRFCEALAETGIAGGAALLSALGLFFWLAFRNLRERLRHSSGWMQFAAAIGCCGFLVHSFALSPADRTNV